MTELYTNMYTYEEITLKELANEYPQSYRNFIPMDRHEFPSIFIIYIHALIYLPIGIVLDLICYILLALLLFVLIIIFFIFYFFPVLHERILFLSTECINKKTDSDWLI